MLNDRDAIEQAAGDCGLGRIVDAERLAGGDTTGGWRLECESGVAFLKNGPASYGDMFSAEADGLRELAGADAVRMPEVFTTGVSGNSAYLLQEYLSLERNSEETDALLGEQLATLHRTQGELFGWHRHNTIGMSPQPNPPTRSWTEFYATHRLEHQLRMAHGRGYDGSLVSFGKRLIEHIDDFFVDYDPRPSLLHGDLWSGNRAVVRGQPVIFDPAVYYGDREADIAMTQLFGGFHPEFLEAYIATWPMAEGYELRLELYKLYHVLNHLNLFGRGYYDQAVSICRHLLSVI